MGRDRSNTARGRWGEDRAAAWYRRHGYRIIARNWRIAAGEIDLIVGRDGLVVFCEVKARRSAGYGGAVAAVDWRKQRQLRRLAALWLTSQCPQRVDVRFDVVAITGTRLDVIENAF